MKKVYKYSTGVEIPKDAIYLSTQVEKRTEVIREPDIAGPRGQIKEVRLEENYLVLHYFLVEVEDEK